MDRIMPCHLKKAKRLYGKYQDDHDAAIYKDAGQNALLDTRGWF
jgi:hypothetical protein